jgi:Rha family phage regulatory protein
MCILVTMEQVNNGDNKVAATTSLKIAEFTEKRHADVLRDIETLANRGKLGERNFALTSYKDKSNRDNKMYLLDETFTTILLMGFTGDKALDWKIAYTQAFQEMRNELSKSVYRYVGDVHARDNEVTLIIAKMAREREGKELHRGYIIQLTRRINELTFGDDTSGNRKAMTDSEAKLLRVTQTDVARALSKGITNPTDIYNYVLTQRSKAYLETESKKLRG